MFQKKDSAATTPPAHMSLSGGSAFSVAAALDYSLRAHVGQQKAASL